MSILNALKTSALTATVVTTLFAGSAQAASLFDSSISTAGPNTAVSDIEDDLGVDLDLLPGFTETTGNVETITFDAEAGDTVTFDFNFSTGEGTIPGSNFIDGGFSVFNGMVELLATSTDADSFTFETGSQTVSFTVADSGSQTLSFGAFNANNFPLAFFPLDNEESILSISNVIVTSAPAAVPEPASIVGLLAVAALGGRSLSKRKHS